MAGSGRQVVRTIAHDAITRIAAERGGVSWMVCEDSKSSKPATSVPRRQTMTLCRSLKRKMISLLV